MKKLLSLLLIVCICFSFVGCNKVTDANSSSLSSTITEIETETVIDEEKSSANNTTTEESKVETTTSNTPSENTTPTQSTIISSNITPSQESTPSSSETPTTSKDPNAPLTDEELKEFMPDWFFEYPAREIVDICEVEHRNSENYDYLVITRQNELYKFSPDKLFSNGSHFKKIESDVKVIKFFACGHTYSELCRGILAPILTTDNKILIYNPNTDKIETHPGLQTSGCIYNECPTDYKNIFSVDWGGDCYGRLGRVGRGCVAESQVRYNNNNILSLDNEILYSFPQDETIISAVTHVVQTTKGYYYIRSTTEQEFADSEPVTTYSAEFIGTKPEDRFIY